jgi:hypothetical protein
MMVLGPIVLGIEPAGVVREEMARVAMARGRWRRFWTSLRAAWRCARIASQSYKGVR